MPYTVRGGDRFYDRPEVKQAVVLLRGAARAGTDEADAAGAMPAAVRHVLASAGRTVSPPSGRGAAREKWESLAAIAALADDMSAVRPQASLADFAAEVTQRAEYGHAPVAEAVTLATMHAAKGLEWDAVLIPGLVEGIMPIVYARTTEAIEEERRVLYVAVTRAREHLVLSWSKVSGGAAAADSPTTPGGLGRLAPGGRHSSRVSLLASRGLVRYRFCVSDSLDDLLDLLDLEQIEVDLFRGRSPDETRQRVFGGQVAAQALVAAGRTVSSQDRPVHSLHAYFIHPGDTTVPLIYSVERVRDGRSFTTRRVSAIQHGRTIFIMSASFQRFEKGVSHAAAMPPVPPPSQVRPSVERLAELLGEPLPAEVRDYPIEFGTSGRSASRCSVTPRCAPPRTTSGCA